MTPNIHINVVDAGGRYGLHPTWKPFTGELKYFLFEPDSIEAARLREKYASRSGEVEVLDRALLDKEGSTRLFLFRNRAMSSSCERNPVVVFYKGEREHEPDIVNHQDVPTLTVDGFCKERQIALDFLKLDTEGTEYLVLQGAQEQLSRNVLGVRCEVAFDRIFKGMPMFSAIHDFMLANNFFLLNLSYDGRGDYSNEFVEVNGKFGILTNCDAVWLKRREFLFEMSNNSSEERAVRVLKYASFCLNNFASDVAIEVLLHARQQHVRNFEPLKDTRLYKFLDRALHQQFYRLKWQPGQSMQKHQQVYSDVFGKRMLEMHEYNESLEMNPD
jgi:FkbM family methyltransferase